MLTSCSRCQFGVPSKARFCSVCGNSSLTSSQAWRLSSPPKGQRNFRLQLSHPLTAAKFITSAKHLGNIVGEKVRSACAPLWDEIKEATIKSKRAARSIAQLAPTEADDEYVLDYHEQIRNSQREFAPQLAALSETVSTAVLVDFAEASDRREQKRRSQMQQKMDAAILKKQLDDLKEWFENYGKDGLIVNAQSVAEDTDERRSA